MVSEILPEPLSAADWLEGAPRPAGPLVPFVTISRLAGAGGHALGVALAALLSADPELGRTGSWPVHDADVCSEIARDPDLSGRLDDLVRETYRPGLEDYLSTVPRPTGAHPIPMFRVFRTVRSLATAGHGIVIGRAGVVITRDLPGGVHVRLIAPREVRAGRMQRRFGLGHEDALAAIREQDGSRARLFLEYFQREIDDPMLYDAVLNTERTSLDTLAGFVKELVRDRLLGARQAAGP